MLTGRAIGLVAALAVAFQAVGSVPAPMRSCCCAEKTANCHCPVCSHARDVQSGCKFVQTCAPGALAATLNAPIAVLPQPVSETIALVMPLPEGPPALAPVSPIVEVPTPPPLQG